MVGSNELAVYGSYLFNAMQGYLSTYQNGFINEVA